MERVTHAKRITALEKTVKRVLGRIRAIEKELEPTEKMDAIGFHYEPHEYDEWAYEDEPLP